MSNYPSVDFIYELCMKKYKSLPKSAKPNLNEWTILAGIIQHDTITTKVVALGLGTKCIGQNKLCPYGFILNDAHAEVLARRSLLRYFYQELRKAAETQTSLSTIFEWDFEKTVFKLKSGITYHFLSTQTPCGDACIVSNTNTNQDSEEIPKKKCKTSNNVNDIDEKVGDLLCTSNNIVYTGAKLIGQQSTVDIMQQTCGAVRTKPGRGDRTLSMSCSDKLSKWNLVGVQGALLDMLLEEPIYFKTLNFCCSSNSESLERAIYKRWQHKQFAHMRFKTIQQPQIRINPIITFEYSQQSSKQPSPTGIVWCDIIDKLKPYEICVNGKRQGVTTKKLNTPQAALKISKYYLLKEFIDLIQMKRELLQKLHLDGDTLQQLTYAELKQLSATYQMAWSELKKSYFEQWTQKPQELLKFSLTTHAAMA